MPGNSKFSPGRHQGLGHHQEIGKQPYSPEVHLNDEHCPNLRAPRAVPFPFYTASNDFWPNYGSGGPEHPEPSSRLVPGGITARQTSAMSSTPGISQVSLTTMSSRSYSTRVSDPNDFAQAWETILVPLLTRLLQQHCKSDFAVDVHNFPEISSDAVPRIIHITLADAVDTAFLEQTIRNELEHAVPGHFGSIYLKFRRGSVERSGSGWWGVHPGDNDNVCEPRNISYRDFPVPGMSIGPAHLPDAASLGGVVMVGGELYAMSAFHAFEASISQRDMRVSHPAKPDLLINQFHDPTARSYSVGSVAMWTPPGTLRPSLTFQGMNLSRELINVEMDWCLIGPLTNGKNLLSVPQFDPARFVAVERSVAVEGNTEVYALARTSGYSLGFTSDVPGLQRIGGCLWREWTVRQYAPPDLSSASSVKKECRNQAQWQTVKQWVTSGIGVPGDSGAWLMRRSDDALMGLIWGRNRNHGNPLERVRLTYFTPMVDILSDIQATRDEQVAFPRYSEAELSRVVETVDTLPPGSGGGIIPTDLSQEPWSALTSEAIQQRRLSQAVLIQRHFGEPAVVPFSSSIAVGDSVHQQSQLTASGRSVSVVPGSGPSPQIVTQVSEDMEGRNNTAVSSPQSLENNPSSASSSVDRVLIGMGFGQRVQSSSLPALSSSSSTSEQSSVAMHDDDGVSELCRAGGTAASVGGGVRVVNEDSVEEVTSVDEPIRTKASLAHRYEELLRLPKSRHLVSPSG